MLTLRALGWVIALILSMLLVDLRACVANCRRFNWAIRKLYKRLLQLGANEIYPTGEADQQHPEGLVITCAANAMIATNFALRADWREPSFHG